MASWVCGWEPLGNALSHLDPRSVEGGGWRGGEVGELGFVKLLFFFLFVVVFVCFFVFFLFFTVGPY